MGDAYASAETDSIRYVSADPSSEALGRDSGPELLFFRVAIVWAFDLFLASLPFAWGNGSLNPSGVWTVSSDVAQFAAAVAV